MSNALYLASRNRCRAIIATLAVASLAAYCTPAPADERADLLDRLDRMEQREIERDFQDRLYRSQRQMEESLRDSERYSREYDRQQREERAYWREFGRNDYRRH